jgi:acyl dehydratase
MSEPAPAETAPAIRGLLFDEFQEGLVFVSHGRTITEADICAFAGLSGDYNPLHTDEEYARTTPFRGRIAHGLLVQAVTSGLASQTGIFEGTTLAVTEMVIRYEAPVRPGDTIHVELRVIGKDPEPALRRGWVRFSTTVVNQRGERVIDGEWLTLMHRQRPRPRRSA